MARLSEHGLRRSVGVPGLFATAYGNVGSSIYYALGLVAAHALGLTPLVFLFAGGLFALIAKTYAEGAAMFPEAGGSSSFARHAFNEVVSFFAGWALSLDYILTIAISAFFVPHYLSAFPGLGALNHNPGDIVGGLITLVVLASLNIRGLGESAKLNFILAITDLSTQVLLVIVGSVLVLNPSLLIHQVHLGSVPTWHELIFALSLAMLAYTGIETVSNMAEEATPAARCPRRSTSWCWPCWGCTWASPSWPSPRCPWKPCPGIRTTSRPCWASKVRGGSRTTRCWASSRGWACTAPCCTSPRTTWACWRRRSCSSPPTPA
jgi:basic amino acid/polyamine antiporter, APA family